MCGWDIPPTILLMGRKETTQAITASVARYFAHTGYSSHVEVGLEAKWSRTLRADVLCLNYKLDLVIVEVKSCIQDFRTDNKWHNYIPFCNRMYLALDKVTLDKLTEEERNALHDYGVGILLVDVERYKTTRYESVVCISNAFRRSVDEDKLMFLLKKAAFKSGLNKGNANSKQYDIYPVQNANDQKFKSTRKQRLRKSRRRRR